MVRLDVDLYFAAADARIAAGRIDQGIGYQPRAAVLQGGQGLIADTGF